MINNIKTNIYYLFSISLLGLLLSSCGGSSTVVTPNLITINGDNPATLTIGSAYTDEGAKAVNTDSSTTTVATITYTVNTAKVGNYVVVYQATDTLGNTHFATRTVQVLADTTAPIISIIGNNPFVLTVGDNYNDAGATANDAVDGAVSVTIITNTVATDTVGNYVVVYQASDTSGNIATATRTVQVLDTTAPTITINGDNLATLTIGSTYTDAGATANDAVDGAVSVTILTNTVATDTVGNYVVVYQASDTSGNIAFATRTVQVADITAPIISIIGANPFVLTVGDNYNDEGATALDAVDGDLTASINTTSSVATNTVGTYSVIYTVADLTGNTATANRTVQVLAVLDNSDVTTTLIIGLNANGVITAIPSNTTNINCGSGNIQCVKRFAKGIQIDLIATPNTGYRFAGWVNQDGTNDCYASDGNNRYQLIADFNCQPNFVPLSDTFSTVITEQTLISNNASAARSIAVADIDGDGDLDVLLAWFNGTHIRLYKNTGSGNFTLNAYTLISDNANNPYSVAAADMDGDGDLDVLSASRNNNNIRWYKNTGSGNFTKNVFTLISDDAKGAFYVEAADMDGDGDLDVLSTSYRYEQLGRLFIDNQIRWYENTGSGNFTKNVFTLISTDASAPGSAVAADMDGDGDLDVLSASFGDNQIRWYENIGSGNFNLGTHTLISNHANRAISVAAADMDGDGDLDVLSASQGDNQIRWYENTGSGNFTLNARTVISNNAGGVNDIAVADMDSDGDLDVLSSSSANNQIRWYENTGSGSFSFNSFTVISNNAIIATNVAVADMDGDGDLDVLSTSSSDEGSRIRLFTNRNPQLSTSSFNYSTSILSVVGVDFSAITGNNNDIDVSQITLVGQGGNSASHTLTSTNVEIASNTMFNIGLNGADAAAVNNIFNKNGDSATDSTAYRLLINSNWNGTNASANSISVTVSGK